MKRPKLTRWEWALFATPLLSLPFLLVSGGEPVSWRYPFLQPQQVRQRNACRSNLKQVSLGLLQYSMDYDYRYPPAVGGGAMSILPVPPAPGWVDSIFPYVRRIDIFKCPASGRVSVSPGSFGITNYYFNSRLSAFNSSKVRRPLSTLLLGDGNDGHETVNSTYNKKSLPASWRQDFTSPAYRHLGGANYAFVDGHVAWLKPDEISDKDGAAHTFSVK